jgi:hypothetical protein
MGLKEIPGTRGFLADEDGNIYGPDEVIRSKYVNGDGYLTSSVKTEDGRWVTFGVHRLVALAHIPNLSPECTEVNHRDNRLKNNKALNLEWVTASQNNIHSEIMREDNLYPTVVAERSGISIGMYRNAKEASESLNVSVLEVWDSIKDSKEVNGVRFIHRPWNGRLPGAFVKPKVLVPKVKTAIKTLDVDNGEIRVFESFYEAAKEYQVSPSHLYKSIPRSGQIYLFKKKYQVAYAEDDFPEISKEDLRIARNRGPKDVVAYHLGEKKYVIFATAKEFVQLTGLSKKAVTTALAKGILRKIDSWVAVYLNDENFAKLKAYVEDPATA